MLDINDDSNTTYLKRKFMHFYILPLKDKTAFKIGKSDSPSKRISTLLNFYNIDIDGVTIVKCKTVNEAFEMESVFKKILREHQKVLPYDGGTEFFDYTSYAAAIELCKTICKIKSYSIIPVKIDIEDKKLLPYEIESNRFSNMVKRKRIEMDVSQSDLSRISRVSKRTIERFETRGQSTFKNTIKIFCALGIKNFNEPLDDNLIKRKRVRKQKKLIFVGDNDHEPDKAWVTTE